MDPFLENKSVFSSTLAENPNPPVLLDATLLKWKELKQPDCFRGSTALRREERRKWGATPTAKGLFHYALLRTDTSFSAYCLLRSMQISPAITPALTELTNSELESWNVQIIFMIDYYLGSILFRYRRNMTQAIDSR